LPGHVVHFYADRVFFNKTYYKIHRNIDFPVHWLHWRHRKLYHDLVSAIFFAKNCYPGDDNAVMSAWLHIELDDLCSRNPAWKAQLEYFAYRARDRRKKSRKSQFLVVKRRRYRRKKTAIIKEEAFVKNMIYHFRSKYNLWGFQSLNALGEP
jgi:hypothetical protein